MTSALTKLLCCPHHAPLTSEEQQAAFVLLPRTLSLQYRTALLNDSFELYWYYVENPSVIAPESVMARIAPQKTLLNRIGELASYGTDCTCCLGYRIWFALFFGIGVGIWIA